MNNDEKLSSIIRTLCLADNDLENLLTNANEVTLLLDLAEGYGLIINRSNGLYSLENAIQILDKSVLYEHLELLENIDVRKLDNLLEKIQIMEDQVLAHPQFPIFCKVNLWPYS